jgi:zinc transport system substrate-binding protein
MRTLILSLSLVGFVLAGSANAEVVTSILPLQAWAQELLEGEVGVLVGPGQSPALYEPTARQLTALSGAEVFFAIGVPFEAALVPRLRRMFPSLEIIELGRGIKRQAWPETDPDGIAHGADPHLWLDPAHAATLVAEMSDVLAGHYEDDAVEIRARAEAMVARFVDLDTRLADRLIPLQGQEILAYHPALGYFATAYGLKQLAVESGGAEPGPRHLAWLADRMEGQSLRVLIVEPQFAPQRARSLAKSLELSILVLDPLAVDLVAELDRFALALLAANSHEEQP